MKKLILAAAAVVMTTAGAFAQDVNSMLAEETCKVLAKDKAKADKDIADAKKSLKASTWVKHAQLYADLTFQCAKIDSMSGVTAYNSYKKALEVEPTTKLAKDINAALNGTDENSKLFNSLMQNGINYNNAKNWAGAFKTFGLSSEVKKADTTASLYTAYMAQQLADDANTLKYFERFIEAGGINSYAYYASAQIYKKNKQTDKAMAILKKGVERNPADKDLKGEIINLNIGSGNTDAVIADLKNLVESDPKNVNYLYNLAITYDNMGKKAEAVEYYQKIIAIDSKNFDAQYMMGVTKFNEAVEIKKTVDKMDMATYKKEGKAVEDKVCARFTEAKVFFDAAKEVKPDDADLKGTMESLQGVLAQCSGRK
jgi:tetratricopeptide (TPR) repeat protein